MESSSRKPEAGISVLDHGILRGGRGLEGATRAAEERREISLNIDGRQDLFRRDTDAKAQKSIFALNNVGQKQVQL